jgi:hypothetical protein
MAVSEKGETGAGVTNNVHLLFLARQTKPVNGQSHSHIHANNDPLESTP